LAMTSTPLAVTAWPLLAGDGQKNIWVSVRDQAGNVTAGQGSIILDRTTPVIFSAALTEGAIVPNVGVTLNVSAQDASEMIIGGTITDSFKDTWQTYQAQIGVHLTAGTGAKTMTVTLRDAAGNASSQSTVNVTLDANDPSAPSSIIVNGKVADGT